MGIQLTIKSEKPFTEVKVHAKGSKDVIIAGIRVYPEKELKQVRKDFSAANFTKEFESLQHELENLKKSGSEDEITDAENELEVLADKQQDSLRNFYASHVVFLKNISLEYQEDGKQKDLHISDTREAKPVESLWETPKECLAVLLDLYLEAASFRDSLRTAILSNVFGIDFKTLEAKN